MSAALWDSIVHNRPGLTVGNDLRPSSTDTSPPAFHSHLLTTTYTSHICIWDPADNLKFPHRNMLCFFCLHALVQCILLIHSLKCLRSSMAVSSITEGCLLASHIRTAVNTVIDLSFCCINSLRGLLMLYLRHFVTLSLRHLPKCLCNLAQSRVLLAQSST